MEIHVVRKHKTPRSIIGELSVNGRFECFTLEDVERDKKIAGQTAIPKGKYKVIINQSARFKRLLPLLLNVPGFEGVRIHSGNTDKDTEGCILVGQSRGKDVINNSRKAFEALFKKMHGQKEISLTITTDYPSTKKTTNANQSSPENKLQMACGHPASDSDLPNLCDVQE